MVDSARSRQSHSMCLVAHCGGQTQWIDAWEQFDEV